jgi:lysophospholipase L1-like esterase
MIMRRFFLFLLLLGTLTASAQKHIRLSTIGITHPAWVGTWAAAPQIPVHAYMPFNNCMTDRSVRQVVKVSIGGDIIRLQLSNEYSVEPVTIKSVYIATARDSSDIVPGTSRYLSFAGHRAVVIPAGKAIFSDAERFPLEALQRLAITINYVEAPKEPTVHMGSRTTSYILEGTSRPSTSFKRAFREEHWFNISAIDVFDAGAHSLAILGNSITDGKGSTDNHQNRWPDIMSDFLNGPSPISKLTTVSTQIGVLNLGIGNNRVLTVGFGSPGKDRFNRDILEQRGVKDVIVFEGINDIGTSRDALTTARLLIEQYRIMISKAHAHHLHIYGATITPMKGCGYYTANHEAGRQMVNEWIRTSKEFDGVIDFDELMRNPEEKEAMRKEWQSDWLHPNPSGYKEMGRYAAEKIKEFAIQLSGTGREGSRLRAFVPLRKD